MCEALQGEEISPLLANIMLNELIGNGSEDLLCVRMAVCMVGSEMSCQQVMKYSRFITEKSVGAQIAL